MRVTHRKVCKLTPIRDYLDATLPTKLDKISPIEGTLKVSLYRIRQVVSLPNDDEIIES
jgi:hypothetical protein